MQLLGQQFRPEFLNRIDEIIIFRGLDRTQLRQITTLLLEQTRRRLRAQNITLEISEQALDWLANRGFQPEFGARPLRRTIQRELDNQLSRLLLGGQLNPGDTVSVTVQDGRLHFATSRGTETDAPEQADGRLSPVDLTAVHEAAQDTGPGDGGTYPSDPQQPVADGAAGAGSGTGEGNLR